MNNPDLDVLIALSLREDIGDGDHTSLACVPSGQMGKAKLLVKETGVLCGVPVAAQVFRAFDPSLSIDILIPDGTVVHPGDVAFMVSGPAVSILQTERLVLNFMQRLSGIATATKRYVDLLEGTNTKILDTRKTTPGLRGLEKYAVKTGGGVNHRIGLYDMVMIKDNHIDYAGGVLPAIERVKEYLARTGKDLKIEVEARNMSEIEQILSAGGVFRILIDNFTPDQTRGAVCLIGGRCETESSGGITIDSLREYALAGVDYISVGALTHHIKSLDLSLKAV